MADDASDMQPMASAPRDGTLIRLWMREGGDGFIGYYSDKWYGWVDQNDPCPLIRGGFRFLGWRPIEMGEDLNAPEPKARRRKGPPTPVRIIR
jgi:hypothetical protein